MYIDMSECNVSGDLTVSAVLLDDDLGALVAVLRGGEVPGADDVLPLGNVVQGVVQLGHVLGHADLRWS